MGFSAWASFNYIENAPSRYADNLLFLQRRTAAVLAVIRPPAAPESKGFCGEHRPRGCFCAVLSAKTAA
jgi:hypothetical protein